MCLACPSNRSTSWIVIIGRVAIDRENIDRSPFAELLEPYRSSPFVDTDSVTPPMGRSRARFEGALGLRLGGFGAGISAGVESREHSTVEFPLRRGGRAATPAVSAGLERVLPWMNARVGTYYRWSEPVETYLLSVNPLQTTLYALQGYDEPMGLPVTNLPVFARIERRTTAIGGTLELTALDARIVLTHEQGKRAEDQNRNPTNPVRPTDRWRAEGSETRVMMQRMFGERIRGTLLGSMESLEGEAVRSDLSGLAFDGRDERMAVEADVRVALNPQWSAALLGGVTRVSSERDDYVVLLGSEIASTTPFVAAEVARRFTRAAISAGVSAAITAPTGEVPPVGDLGPNYQRIIAPALAYDAAEARAVAAWVTGAVPLRGRMLLASVRAEQTTPTSIATSRLQPGGSRSGWSLSVGVR